MRLGYSFGRVAAASVPGLSRVCDAALLPSSLASHQVRLLRWFPPIYVSFFYVYCKFLEKDTKRVLDLMGTHYLMFLGFRKW